METIDEKKPWELLLFKIVLTHSQSPMVTDGTMCNANKMNRRNKRTALTQTGTWRMEIRRDRVSVVHALMMMIRRK